MVSANTLFSEDKLQRCYLVYSNYLELLFYKYWNKWNISYLKFGGNIIKLSFSRFSLMLPFYLLSFLILFKSKDYNIFLFFHIKLVNLYLLTNQFNWLYLDVHAKRLTNQLNPKYLNACMAFRTLELSKLYCQPPLNFTSHNLIALHQIAITEFNEHLNL